MREFWARLWRRKSPPNSQSHQHRHKSSGPAYSRESDGRYASDELALDDRTRRSEREARELVETCRAFHERWDITFHDPGLLHQALTHRSFVGESGLSQVASNERMEFLGDSVLELVVNEFLYRRYPTSREGDLTKKRSLLVSRRVLALRADEADLGGALRLSGAEHESGGRTRASILADGFEAVIGAIYLDQGLETARRFIHDSLLEVADEILSDEDHVNFKSRLQELVQSRSRSQPRYRVRDEKGPDHDKTFVLEVVVKGEVLGTGRGPNKKDAEQHAARDALQVLRVRDPGDGDAE